VAGSVQKLIHLYQKLLLLILQLVKGSLDLISSRLFLHPFLLSFLLLRLHLQQLSVEFVHHVLGLLLQDLDPLVGNMPLLPILPKIGHPRTLHFADDSVFQPLSII
jgi:hypothetical protein